MKSRAITSTAIFATIASSALLFDTVATAQTAAKPDAASMVISPGAPGAPNASGARATNPDNMPVKRPTTPPNANRMILNSPASDAIAK